MPKTKNYKGKKANDNKRRPHHDIAADTVKSEQIEMDVVHSDESVADEINTEAANEGVIHLESGDNATNGSPAHVNLSKPQAEAEFVSEGGPSFGDEPSEKKEKTRLEFYGSELIRQRAPKAMDIADTVADEWMNDGQFQGLPLGNPLTQMAAAKALRTAKDVEKKLEEKGVFMMARIGLDLVKSKLKR